mgnify:CR=1 FL=1
MRVVFLGNNWVGWQVLSYLIDQGEDVVATVLHAPGKRAFEAELVGEAMREEAQLIDAPDLHAPETLDLLRALKPDIAVSAMFDYILRKPVLDLFPQGCLNLHPSYLPFNRGQYPNVWSIVEGTPAGATLHYMDETIDTGDIVAQIETPVSPYDTGETLYRKLEEDAVTLFQKTWPLLRAGTASRTPQPREGGGCHRVRDVEAIDAIDLDATYTARDLINRMRARTFPPHSGVYYDVNGQRVYVRLQLLREDEL